MNANQIQRISMQKKMVLLTVMLFLVQTSANQWYDIQQRLIFEYHYL